MEEIKLTNAEHKWLEDLLLNPINVRFPADEKEEDKKIRIDIANTLRITKK